MAGSTPSRCPRAGSRSGGPPARPRPPRGRRPHGHPAPPGRAPGRAPRLLGPERLVVGVRTVVHGRVAGHSLVAEARGRFEDPILGQQGLDVAGYLAPWLAHGSRPFPLRRNRHRTAGRRTRATQGHSLDPNVRRGCLHLPVGATTILREPPVRGGSRAIYGDGEGRRRWPTWPTA